jgi:stearoyl-CoA desaturase (delta-9 desaturase)
MTPPPSAPAVPLEPTTAIAATAASTATSHATSTATSTVTNPAPPAEPVLATETKAGWENIALGLFIAVPFLALVAAVPVAWGWGLGWRDLVLAVVMYVISGHGITVGFHRHFTHGSFRANRGLKIALAVAGSLAIEGPVVRWVADHRRHHAFSDREGDPHSPWRYGETVPALAKGLLFAHMGWLFDVEQTNPRRYAPDLIKDRDVERISRLFPAFVAASLLLPALLGGLLSWSWQGALTAFFWASLIRVGLLHHVTWSINSICHAIGEQPFKSRDHSGNVWWLALLSMGESWHNLHHADPTCARHGVLRGQIDSSARMIWIFERLGWATDVRWPKVDRLAARRA